MLGYYYFSLHPIYYYFFFYYVIHSQESWIQQMSFRDNILFGKPYNEQLYKRVIDACALENDIKVKRYFYINICFIAMRKASLFFFVFLEFRFSW